MTFDLTGRLRLRAVLGKTTWDLRGACILEVRRPTDVAKDPFGLTFAAVREALGPFGLKFCVREAWGLRGLVIEGLGLTLGLDMTLFWLGMGLSKPEDCANLGLNSAFVFEGLVGLINEGLGLMLALLPDRLLLLCALGLIILGLVSSF